MRIACLCVLLVGCGGGAIVTDGGGNDGGLDARSVRPDGGFTGCMSAEDCNDGNPCNGNETCSVAGLCVPGRDLDLGTECDLDPMLTRELCFSGFCRPSVCGDRFIDAARGEVCDDGNDVSGDGCEPLGCRFTCTGNGDCDDSNPCSGMETCDTAMHTCLAGKPLVEDASCGAGVVCRGGVCISTMCGDSRVNPPEECDPPGSTGCAADCTFICTEATDCDDGDVCNGTESCAGDHTCTAGTSRVCTPSDACHTSMCTARAGGCVEALIDGDGDGHAAMGLGSCGDDCNDADPAVFTGAPEICDGMDNNCNGAIDDMALAWYVDCDGDGFAGAGAMSVESCSEPPADDTGCAGGGSWTTTAPGAGTTDCLDSNPSAFPAQSVFFVDPYTDASSMPSWDYDCDGDETIEFALRGRCLLLLDGSCSERRGFIFATTAAPPDCGEPGIFMQRCSATCTPVTQRDIRQTCN